MKNVRVRTKVFTPEELKTNPHKMKKCEWGYAFVQTGDGVYLCEVYSSGAYIYASGDIVDEKLFTTILKEDKDMYLGKNWHEYRSDIIKDLLILEEYEKEVEI